MHNWLLQLTSFTHEIGHEVELLSTHPEPAIKAACLGASSTQCLHSLHFGHKHTFIFYIFMNILIILDNQAWKSGLAATTGRVPRSWGPQQCLKLGNAISIGPICKVSRMILSSILGAVPSLVPFLDQPKACVLPLENVGLGRYSRVPDWIHLPSSSNFKGFLSRVLQDGAVAIELLACAIRFLQVRIVIGHSHGKSDTWPVTFYKQPGSAYQQGTLQHGPAAVHTRRHSSGLAS